MFQNPYADAPRLPETQPLQPEQILGCEDAPFELEIGPGRGGFMFERLSAAADVRLIGLEIRRKWASLVDAKLCAEGHAQRARVFAEDAREVLPRFAPACFTRVFVHFPDPWWKKRHAKRRVLRPEFVLQLARVLRSGGELFIQTDVLERAEGFEALLEDQLEFAPVAQTARVEHNPFGAQSPRERRATLDGIPIYRLHYRRTAVSRES